MSQCITSPKVTAIYCDSKAVLTWTDLKWECTCRQLFLHFYYFYLLDLNVFPLTFFSLRDRNILQMSSNVSAIDSSLAAAYITAEGTYPDWANVFTSYHTALTGSDVYHPAKICDLFTWVIKSWILFVFSFPSMFNRFFFPHLLGIKVIPVKYD